MSILIRILLEANLLNSRSNLTLGFVGVILLFLFLVSIMKRVTKLIIFTGIIFALFACTYVAKVNIVDNNKLEFTATYVKSPDGQIEYEDIAGVALSNDNKRITLTSEDGDEIVLKVDTNYGKALKEGIEKMSQAKAKK